MGSNVFAGRFIRAAHRSAIFSFCCLAAFSFAFAPVAALGALEKAPENTSKVRPDSAAPIVQWASGIVEATSYLKRVGQYSPWQLLGKPNILSLKGDTNPCSWAAGEGMDGNSADVDSSIVVRLRLAFATPIQARQVLVAENLNPGAIGRIVVFGPQGDSLEVYKSKPRNLPERWRLLTVFFEPPPFLVNQVELSVHTGAVPGWNEIDAVAISSSADTIRPQINLAADAFGNAEPENLGPMINSEFRDILPIVSPDGKTLYICRAGHPENIGSRKRDDIWFAEMDQNGFWGEIQNIGEPLNNQNHNFLCSISPDGNSVLLGNVYTEAGGTGPGVSISRRTRNGWTFPEALQIEGFHNSGPTVDYCLSNDGNILMMALEREGTYGGTDIFVSFPQESGVWTYPLNIGPDVNTGGQEATVFLAADNRTIYFSSEGHNGYGRHDIFMSQRLGDSWEHWTEPLNLGPAINTDDFDAFFSITASGDYAYFASRKNTFGESDIFRLPLPREVRPLPVVLVQGTVLDYKTGKPVEARIYYENLANGRSVGEARSNPLDGSYQITLPAGELYGFRAHSPNFIAINEHLDLRALEEYEELQRDLLLIPIEKGQTVRLNNIFFNSGTAELLSSSYPELDRVLEVLNNNPGMTIVILGHTDNVGDEADNETLSLQRAKAVSAYLQKNGIAGKRLSVQGMGESIPVADNTTNEGRQLNRRVEFRIESE